MTTAQNPRRQSRAAEPDTFVPRHIGPRDSDVAEMLQEIGYASLDAFIDVVVPEQIRFRETLSIGPARTEHDVLAELRALSQKNRVFRSYLGVSVS